VPERVPLSEPEVEHHPGAPEGMLPALASIGLYKIELRERETRPPRLSQSVGPARPST